jgi:hypothetical protein
MKLKLSILATATLLALSAHATTTDWGVHDPLEVAAAITPVGLFDDTYLFSLLASSSIFSTAVTNNLTGVLGITGGQVALYKSGPVDTLIGSFAYNDASGSISHSFGAVSSGDYFYAVTGTGTGTLGGFYTLSSTVSAVPEPETYAMLLAGLGVVGFLGLRRQS